MGSSKMTPAPSMASPLGWASTALPSKLEKLKPESASSSMAIRVTPDSSNPALIICTQVVANMPPKAT